MSGNAREGKPAKARWAISLGVAAAAIAAALIIWQVASGGTSGGTGSEVQESGAESTAQPMPTDTPQTLPEMAEAEPSDVVDTRTGLTVRLEQIESVEGEVVVAGDIAGPAIRLTIRIDNNTETPFDLGVVAVNAYVGASQRPATSLIAPGGAPFTGAIEPGGSAAGVYLFSVPADERDLVKVSVDYAAGQPAIVFLGAMAN